MPGLPRCTDASVFSCSSPRRSVAMMIVSKMAPHSDLVSCSVLKHCLMIMPISCVVLLQKAAGFFFEPARETASPRAPAFVSLLSAAEPRPPLPTCAESVCVSSCRPPSGHPPEPALFPRVLLASIDTENDFATEATGKLTRDGLGWQNDRKAHQWMCKQFHRRTGCAGETLEKRSATEMRPRPPDSDQTTLKRQRVSVLSVWLRLYNGTMDSTW